MEFACPVISGLLFIQKLGNERTLSNSHICAFFHAKDFLELLCNLFEPMRINDVFTE